MNAIKVFNCERIAFVAIIITAIKVAYNYYLFGFCVDHDNLIGNMRGYSYGIFPIFGIRPFLLKIDNWLYFILLAVMSLMLFLGLWRLFFYRKWMGVALTTIILLFLTYTSRASREFSCELKKAHENIISTYINIKNEKERNINLKMHYDQVNNAYLYRFNPESWGGGEAQCSAYILSLANFAVESRINALSGWVEMTKLSSFPYFSDTIFGSNRVEIAKHWPGSVHIAHHFINEAGYYTIIYCFDIPWR
jgi:Ca2+/Na+ antiporter